MERVRPELPHLNTVVIKVGSRIVTADHASSYRTRMRGLADGIMALRNQGTRVLLVSSGAIAHGMDGLGLQNRPRTLPMQQACASVGQSRLMDAYARLFQRRNQVVGQVLLTWDDLRDKQRYLNLRNTLFQLLDAGVLPVVNENDSVGVDEINFGDNDTLGAQVSLLVGAELYVMLTDVDGLYEENPSRNSHAEHIARVEKLTPHIHDLARGSVSGIGVGGMTTKLKAADMVTRAGIWALIGDGRRGKLDRLLGNDGAGTLFVPARRRMSTHRRWIAFTRSSAGTLVVDAGAARAITQKGKSLLPAGIRRHEGRFAVGDMVTIVDEQGGVLAHGLINYSSDEVGRIQGHRTSSIEQQLGYKRFDEVIHRDNMAILEEAVE